MAFDSRPEKMPNKGEGAGAKPGEHGLRLHYGMHGDLTEYEHTRWCQSVWWRLDRDRTGTISRDELNCDEFQGILRLALTPDVADADGARASYGRSEQNVQALLEFCLRKADLNNDGYLQFDEFRALMRALRSEKVENSAELVFAMFDLDCDQVIDRNEFVELFRYYNARRPREPELQEEWSRLDPDGQGYVSKVDFLRWMQTTANPIFRQHAPPLADASRTTTGVLRRSEERKIPVEGLRPAPGLLPHMYTGPCQEVYRPPWNRRFRGVDTVILNKGRPQSLRTYFSRPQSLPELHRFYNTYKGFENHRRKLKMPDAYRKNAVASSEVRPEQDISPGRHLPDGIMRNKKKQVVQWDNAWVPTQAELALQKRVDTGVNYLRCPSQSDMPAHLFLGRDAPD